jgi:hypothetical protein
MLCISLSIKFPPSHFPEAKEGPQATRLTSAAAESPALGAVEKVLQLGDL